MLNLRPDLSESLWTGGDVGWDIVDDHLDQLDLFLEASGSGDESVDGGLKLFPVLEEEVGGGIGYSDEEYVVVGGEANFSNGWPWEDSVDRVADGEGREGGGEWLSISGNDEGPVPSGRGGRSGGGGFGGGFGLAANYLGPRGAREACWWGRWWGVCWEP